jgi:HSP20 family protein
LEDLIMTDTPTELSVKNDKSSMAMPWKPFENLRREIDRLFDDFSDGFWRMPFRRSAFDLAPFWGRESSWPRMPAVDFTDTDKAYEITAELPGIDGKNLEVKVASDVLTIKGERREEKEEKQKEYYLRERNVGSFADKIEAKLAKGILTVTLPKKAEAQRAAKKIEVKAA